MSSQSEPPIFLYLHCSCPGPNLPPASSYISLPPVLSLAINFLTQFQFCFILKEYMYIVLRFGIKAVVFSWQLALGQPFTVHIHDWGFEKSYWIRELLTVGWSDTAVSVLHCGCGDFSCGTTLLLWIMDSRAHRLVVAVCRLSFSVVHVGS